MVEKKTPKEQVDNEKVMAALAYLIFFIPLLTAKESKFAMFHANQGFNLFLLFVAVNVIGTIIPIIGWLILLPLGNIFAFVLMVMGILNAMNGVEKELPIIGKYKLLKL